MDADHYPDWLIGARQIRGTDDSWPRAGSSFRHRVGMGPVEVKDRTTVMRSEEGRRLDLLVRARPILRASVRFELRAAGAGTELTMDERPVGRFALLAPVMAPFVKLRNDRSLAHFTELIETGGLGEGAR